MRSCCTISGGLLLVALLSAGCESGPTETTVDFIVDGLQVVFHRTPGRPIIAAGFYLRGGANYTGGGRVAIEPLLFSAMIRGTENLRGAELRSTIGSLGMQLDIQWQPDFSGLVASWPSENHTQAWQVFTDIVLNPLLAPGDLEEARKEMLNNIVNAGEDVEEQVRRMALRNFYVDHPYALRVLEAQKDIRSHDRRDLIQYFQADITKNRALMVVVGDIDEKRLIVQLRRIAGKIPLGPDMLAPAAGYDSGTPELKVSRKDLPCHYLMGMFAAPSPGHEDYPAFSIAMGLLQDRLHAHLVEQTGLAQLAKTSTGMRRANMAYFLICSSRPTKAVSEIRWILEGLLAAPLDSMLVRGVAQRQALEYMLAGASATGMRDQLAAWDIAAQSWVERDQYLRELQTVTTSQVQRMYRKYFRRIHYSGMGNPNRYSRRAILSQ